jgi:tagatose-6-phosphate ketose/aldose isomerase
VGQLLVLSAGAPDLHGLNAVVVPGMTGGSDTELLFPFVVWAQLLALGRSLALGCAPDSPSRSGAVNRVVKGVTIYRSSR